MKSIIYILNYYSFRVIEHDIWVIFLDLKGNKIHFLNQQWLTNIYSPKDQIFWRRGFLNTFMKDISRTKEFHSDKK